MTNSNIIKEVVKIILKHARPSRIYLFGSVVDGETKKAGDIDIAFDDPDFTSEHLIQEEIDKLPTLVKIDVKNISHADKRFKNRVTSTGRVLFSGNKKTRAEDGLYNFSKAYEKFSEAIDLKESLYSEGFSDVYADIIVKRFEFTYEMGWKAIKRYLSSVGIECLNPKQCFQEGSLQGLIDDESIWLEIMEQRNLSSHVYSEIEAHEIMHRATRYRKAFADLKEKLEKRI